MQRRIPKILIEAGALATLGAGVYVLKGLRTTPHLCEEIRRAPYAAASQLGPVLERLKELDQHASFCDAVGVADQFVRSVHRADGASHGSQFLANRLMAELDRRIRAMVAHVKTASRDLDALNSAILVEDEDLPAINAICDSMLHNMLMT